MTDPINLRALAVSAMGGQCMRHGWGAHPDSLRFVYVDLIERATQAQMQRRVLAGDHDGVRLLCTDCIVEVRAGLTARRHELH